STPPAPTGTFVVRETLNDTISATASPQCSQTFRSSVDPTYFQGGTGRCVEFARTSETAGLISARLTWPVVQLDLDLVLNDMAGSNFRQSIAANRCCETVDFFVNAGTKYAFIVYLRGIDPVFVSNGGVYNGSVSTPFTLTVERPK